MENKTSKLIIVTGNRPNLIKGLPLASEFTKQNIPYEIYNPCQHYNFEMNGIFESELSPLESYSKINYGYRAQSNPIKNVQEMIFDFNSFIELLPYDIMAVFVVGDTNASLACALAAHRKNIPVVHIESGLRSFDISMPEELNRITIDHISDLLLASCVDGARNLSDEAIIDDVYMVGNTGIDTLVKVLPRIDALKKNHILVTLHRRENINNIERFTAILKEIVKISNLYKVIFPVHPHTKNKIEENYNDIDLSCINCVNPLGYKEFVSLMISAKCVITDSGGVQEETTYLGIPCLTVRENTERPITIRIGTNVLVSPHDIYSKLISYDIKDNKIPNLWDGLSSGRIVEILKLRKFI